MVAIKINKQIFHGIFLNTSLLLSLSFLGSIYVMLPINMGTYLCYAAEYSIEYLLIERL